MRNSLSIVVPVFNSASSLPTLVDRLEAVLAHLAGESEIVLVIDGSADASWSVIERLAVEHEGLRGIDLMRNYGQHNALLAGIRAARNDIVVTLDDDLQNPQRRSRSWSRSSTRETTSSTAGHGCGSTACLGTWRRS